MFALFLFNARNSTRESGQPFPRTPQFTDLPFGTGRFFILLGSAGHGQALFRRTLLSSIDGLSDANDLINH